MKAELQFFMLPSDAETFIRFATDHVDTIKPNQGFGVGDCELAFQPSRWVENTLMVGTLSVDSGGLDDGCKDHLRANKAYRTLRKWIKAHYDNRLSTWIEGEEHKIGRTRNQWLAPDAKLWKQANNDTVMRFSTTNSVLFDIAPEFVKMGTIEPKGEKFKARS
ncbi:MAG: hypothetical protein KAH03_03220 [Cocleimonas sp.]|nr:hypothetical protein [Cocleimonas sp.]